MNDFLKFFANSFHSPLDGRTSAHDLRKMKKI